MGYTLIDKDTITSATTQVDYTLNSDYDEILFTVTGYKSNTDERQLGFQFITSGASGYDRPTQSAATGQWLYAHDYSHGGKRYEHSYDSDISEASSTSTQFNVYTKGGDTHRAHSSAAGVMTLYKPHDTSFYKYWILEASCYDAHISDFQQLAYHHTVAGYIKDNNALTGIRFVSCNYAGDQDGSIAKVEISMYGLE